MSKLIPILLGMITGIFIVAYFKDGAYVEALERSYFAVFGGCVVYYQTGRNKLDNK